MVQETQSDEEEVEERPEEAQPAGEETARLEELNALLQRAQADYKNLRRRSAADLEAGVRREMQPLLEELLLVLDFLDLALTSPIDSQDAKNLAQGVEMTRNKLAQALESAGVHPISTGGSFDPALHEAIASRFEEGVAPGTILETVRRGYTWHESALRYARVVVAAEGASAGAAKGDERPEPKDMEEE